MAVWTGVRGAAAPAFKADAKYAAIHMWLRRNYVKTGTCERCGAEGRTEWSCVTSDFRNRDRSNWRELCRSCHVLEDHANPKRPLR